MRDGIGFLLAHNLPMASFSFELFCYRGIGLQLVEYELLDDMPSDELGAVESEVCIVDGMSLQVCFRLIEEIDGYGIVDGLEDEAFILCQSTYIAAGEGVPFPWEV